MANNERISRDLPIIVKTEDLSAVAPFNKEDTQKIVKEIIDELQKSLPEKNHQGLLLKADKSQEK